MLKAAFTMTPPTIVKRLKSNGKFRQVKLLQKVWMRLHASSSALFEVA